MARPAQGQVVVRERKGGRVYALRFHAYGQRQFVTLGSSADGWTHARAEEELQNVLADVRRGLWRPPEPPPIFEPPTTVPTFHEFASEWWEAKKLEVRPNTRAAYENELTLHLLPFFAKHRLTDITIQEVDRYRQHKVREGRLGPETINKTLVRLAQILEVAVEYDLIPRNPAAGKRRRLKVDKPRPVHLDSAAQIVALLDAASALDARPTARTSGRRALIATLAFAGLRSAEAVGLQWRDVDLASGRIYVGRSKTDAGMREVDMLPVLRDELLSYKASHPRTGLDDYVFTTAAGGKRDKDNLARRVMGPIVARTDELLAERGEHPLPVGVTAHKLRHTFASMLIALGKDPAYVMGQLGHADPKFTLRVYTHMMRRGDDERQALLDLVEGKGFRHQKAPVPKPTTPATNPTEPGQKKTPLAKRGSGHGRGWVRTSDLSRVKRALSH